MSLRYWQRLTEQSVSPNAQTIPMLTQEIIDLAESIERGAKAVEKRVQIQANVVSPSLIVTTCPDDQTLASLES